MIWKSSFLRDIFVTFIGAGAVFVVGLLAYNSQKDTDEFYQNRAAKRQVYADYLSSFVVGATYRAEGDTAKTLEARAATNSAQMRMMVWAEDDVMEALADFQAAIDLPLAQSGRCNALEDSFEALITAMRNDVFGGAHSDALTLFDAAPIDFCGDV